MSDTYVRLSRVAAVRPSGVDKATVAGEVPVRLCNYTDVYYGDRLTAAQGFMEASATAEEVRRFELRRDDVVLTKDSETADDIAIPAWVAEDLDDVVLGYHTALIRPSPDVDGRYLYWLLQSKASQTYFELAARGVTRCGLRQEDIARLPVPALALPEQRRIADYLDRETERIDDLIESNSRLARLLQERTQSAIEDMLASIAGPSPQLRRVAELIPGYAFSSSDFCSEEGGAIRLLRGINVSPSGADWSAETMWLPYSPAGLDRYRLREGDIVMGMDRPWISSGIRATEIGPEDVPSLLVQRVLRVLPSRVLDRRYCLLAMRSARFYAHFEPDMTGISVPHVSAEQIGTFRLPLPDLRIQQAKAALVFSAEEHERSIIGRLDEQNGLLHERRQALITAAVTGQLDVGEAA